MYIVKTHNKRTLVRSFPSCPLIRINFLSMQILTSQQGEGRRAFGRHTKVVVLTVLVVDDECCCPLVR